MTSVETMENRLPDVHDIVNAVSQAMGTRVVVAEASRKPDGAMLYRLRIDGDGVFPRLSIGDARVEVVLTYENRLGINVSFYIGDKVFGNIYTSMDGSTSHREVADFVLRAINETFSVDMLRALDEAVTTLRNSGLRVTSMHKWDKNCFYVTATDESENTIVNAFFGNRNTVEVEVYNDYAGYLVDNDITTLVNENPLLSKRFIDLSINDEEKKVSVLVNYTSVPEVPTLVYSVGKVVDEAIARKRKMADAIEPSEALAIYLAGLSYNHVYDLVAETGVTYWMILDKTRQYFENVLGKRGFSENLVAIVKELYEKGILRIDEWRVVIDGRKLLDVIRKYSNGRISCQVSDEETYDARMSEHDIITIVLEECSVDLGRLLSQSPRVPLRIVETIASNRVLSEKYLELFVRNPDVWANLSPEAKFTIISASPEIIELAKEREWRWVFEDPYLVAQAVTRGSKTPAEVTKRLLEKFPEFIGDAEVFYVKDEPFIRVAGVTLQVRRVFGNSVEVHGTMGRSSIGIVARAKTVYEAAKAIARDLVDTVLEYRELEKTLRSIQDGKIKITEITTPLFRIPAIVAETPTKRIEIPLQAGITRILREKHVISNTDENLYNTTYS